MNDELDSICPIFVRYDNGKLDQIGSGVLLRFKDKLFLITAAHVSDWSEKGVLCIPTNSGFNAIAGYFASVLVPKGLTRSQDKIDMAYFRLDHSLVDILNNRLKPLQRNDCWLSDNVQPDDIYTFSGYPVSKSKTKGDKYLSEIFSFSGAAAISRKYKNLKYDQETNIIVNFRRKKSVTPEGEVSGTSPKRY